MSTRVEARETLTCDCGRTFEVSARYARCIRRGEYPQKCSECARGARCKPYEELRSVQMQAHRGPVSDRERRWCLEHYTDDEILAFAEATTGQPGDPAEVRRWREKLEVPAPLPIDVAA